MTQNVKSRIEAGKFVVSSSRSTQEDYTAFMGKHGFSDEKPKRKFNITAKHNDLGQMVEVDANEMFLLVESDGYARFWKVVNSEDDAKIMINKIIEESKEYGYSYFPVGTSIYLCQDLKEFRITHSD